MMQSKLGHKEGHMVTWYLCNKNKIPAPRLLGAQSDVEVTAILTALVPGAHLLYYGQA